MHPVQATRTNAVLDRVARHAGRQQLGTADNAALLLRQIGDPSVGKPDTPGATLGVGRTLVAESWAHNHQNPATATRAPSIVATGVPGQCGTPDPGPVR